MNYSSELKKFATSQYVYAAIRITIATVIPSMILGYFGLLKEFFLFPLGTSFLALTDQPGPFIRRRNSLLLALVCFIIIATIASLAKGILLLVLAEIVFFGLFFSIIGVYGQRLAAVGSLALVVLSIFIDGHLTGDNIFKSILIFSAGCIWFFIIFLVVSTIQPYKLASQMIGENYIQLAAFLKVKAKFYQKNQNFNALISSVISQQVFIKNLQEETRETVFKTRTIVNESTTTSRLLMIMFLNSIDLHEKIMTSESDYQKLQNSFEDTTILDKINEYLLDIAEEITNIGIALQSNAKAKPMGNLTQHSTDLYDAYCELRNKNLNAETLEEYIILRQIIMRIHEITEQISDIYTVFSQNENLAKSLSTGLDLKKFLPKQEKINRKVLFSNLSFESLHFRHAIRVTLALLLGYLISFLPWIKIGHTYWILITIIAILKPAYAITKQRNLLRLYGTIVGALSAYILLLFIENSGVLFAVLLLSMVLCFSYLKANYFWAVLFMTIYIFLSFNFLKPGNLNALFSDRIIDTLIAGAITFLVSYLVLPVWEHTQNGVLMKKCATDSNLYFMVSMTQFSKGNIQNTEEYKEKRKNAIISLANVSDNFQRMISEPKNRQKKLELVHQFVVTSHLITAYTASISQYFKSNNQFPEIEADNWIAKIDTEMQKTISLLNSDENAPIIAEMNKEIPNDLELEKLLNQRKKQLTEQDLIDHRDPNKISHLTELKNIHDLLELLFDVVKEQNKITQKYKIAVNILPK